MTLVQGGYHQSKGFLHRVVRREAIVASVVDSSSSDELSFVFLQLDVNACRKQLKIDQRVFLIVPNVRSCRALQVPRYRHQVIAT
jgi:hypothetical protein